MSRFRYSRPHQIFINTSCELPVYSAKSGKTRIRSYLLTSSELVNFYQSSQGLIKQLKTLCTIRVSQKQTQEEQVFSKAWLTQEKLFID